MCRHVRKENTASPVANDEEYLEHAKRSRRHREEVHSGKYITVVLQKPLASLDRVRSGRLLGHGARYGEFRYQEAELTQLGVDPGRTPTIVCCHLADEVADLAMRLWSPFPQ